MAAPRTTVAVRWSNGQLDRAATWEELEDDIRVDQFSEFAPDEFRMVLAKRALRWSGKPIRIDGPSALFFMELAWAKLIEIVDTTKKED